MPSEKYLEQNLRKRLHLLTRPGSVWIVIKSHKVQLNLGKEDGGVSRKDAIRGRWQPKPGESAGRGKGLLCFLPRRSNNIFWSPLCASLLCRCQNTHSQGWASAKHANSLSLQLPATPIVPMHVNRFQPQNDHCPDCACVWSIVRGCIQCVRGRMPRITAHILAGSHPY